MGETAPTLALTAGDPLGIGPEIVAKALADPRVRALGVRFRLHGDEPTLRDAFERFERADADVIDHGRTGGTPVPPPFAGPSAEGGRVSFAAVEAAIADVQAGRAAAIVTAPIAKESWRLAGVDYPGHTELLAERFASPRSAMLFVGPTLRVILATIHVPLVKVSGLLTVDRVTTCIELAAEACRELGVASPRVAVAGLNPHAGESRQFGDEDADVLVPAVARARAAGIDASGPWPGDVVFLHAAEGRHDAVVAMYHDQGLIPVKLLDRSRAVNVTAGLRWGGRPVVRTSPAHGTAFDIAGRGVADAESMVTAVLLAARMVAGCARRA